MFRSRLQTINLKAKPIFNPVFFYFDNVMSILVILRIVKLLLAPFVISYPGEQEQL